MILNNDRIQTMGASGNYLLFEFLTVNTLHELQKVTHDHQLFMDQLTLQLSAFEKTKIDALLAIEHNTSKMIILYQKHVQDYILYLAYDKEIKIRCCQFDELQLLFQKINGGNMTEFSKKLGSTTKETNEDPYVNTLLKEIHGMDHFSDDNGIELTKKLLGDHATTGFDLDLYQYIESTGEFVFYEFLKRENQYISNIEAHPMRYCWNKANKKDNKKKYISLWRAKQHFGGRLFLINYSDDLNEKVSIIEVLDLDEEKGILKEKKYCLSYNVFVSWLKDMNRYNKPSTDYLADFKEVIYDQSFMTNFHENKKRYGKEFAR